MARKIAALGGILALVLIGLSSSSIPIARAEESTPTEEPYARRTTLTFEYTAYQWWVVEWRTNWIACELVIEHEGLPYADEIRTWCEPHVYNLWRNTQPCVLSTPDQPLTSCPGYYLHLAEQWQASREIEVELPLPTVWLNLEGCSPELPPGQCDRLPLLRLEAEEPLPNEIIIAVNGSLGGEPFTCRGATCSIPLRPTGLNGETLEFWADSSYGDSSPHYTALVRVLPRGDFMAPEGNTDQQPYYYVDILSSQWRGSAPASCAETWQAFPEPGGPPPWLSTPDDPQALYSSLTLYYLAGILISRGEIDATDCPSGGLQAPLIANACGVQRAYDLVLEWQNRFDEEIWRVAQESGVPAQLLKNIFSRESQFWPGIYQSYREAGLGQLTENGADTLLLWNPGFFAQFCPLVLHQSRCDLGFGNLKAEEQAMLRGALVRQVNASCPECPAGIDLTQAQFSVRVFAEGLKANCEQVGRLISNLTGRRAGEISSYTDLWRFTLVNYNAGPGCLLRALRGAYAAGEPLDWEHVAAHLEPVCQSAIDYVRDISERLSGIQPTPTSWVYPGQTPPSPPLVIPPTPTPRPTSATPVPGGPTPTPGPGYYPPGTLFPTQPGGYPEPGATATPGGNYPGP
ncbi:hypothetical protein QYE77_12275 [Thermanaerothrix sp. 4228-RoL]|uniref:Transglycosylase SLT domain-containing protein n=1 Tax=Thermanaerothrix solaris TaxID=3058434 RepID=A0ABU3NQE8_9CHLR|nr:hypothetical protein [Thermanaerothrix sp. 4228-RoL]MDT8899041.1 hypothetical protein [Thermanaerothrix sp. 4228-RoL]